MVSLVLMLLTSQVLVLFQEGLPLLVFPGIKFYLCQLLKLTQHSLNYRECCLAYLIFITCRSLLAAALSDSRILRHLLVLFLIDVKHWLIFFSDGLGLHLALKGSTEKWHPVGFADSLKKLPGGVFASPINCHRCQPPPVFTSSSEHLWQLCHAVLCTWNLLFARRAIFTHSAPAEASLEIDSNVMQ